MANIATRDKIFISKAEYRRLKDLTNASGFLSYVENLMDVREARKEINRKKIISQEALFKKLGF